MVDVVPPSTTLAFVTKMSEKYESTSSSAIQAKNRQKTIGSEDILDVTGRLEKVELLTCTVMLDLLIVAYVQFMIMLTELQRVMSGTTGFAYIARPPQSYLNKTYQNCG